MRINSINTTFQGASNLSKLAQKAEERLQKRLVDANNLMGNYRTNEYFYIPTGELFSGKFVVNTDKIQQLFKIKDGKLVSTLVRDASGAKKVLGNTRRQKYFVQNPSSDYTFADIEQLSALVKKTQGQMVERYEKMHGHQHKRV